MCTDRDREIRNCGNRLGLSEAARAVEKYTEEVIAEIQGKKAGKVFQLGTIRLYECPLTLIEPETWEVVRLAYMVEHTGHLLFAGSLGDQPVWLIEAMKILRAESARAAKPPEGGKDERRH